MSPIDLKPSLNRAAATAKSMAVRRLVPYGREVQAALDAGHHPNVRVFACRHAWRLAREHRHTFGPGTVLVLPPGENPEAYRWPNVRDLMGNITGLPGEHVRHLAHALVRDGCRLAYLLDSERPERNLRVIARGSSWRSA